MNKSKEKKGKIRLKGGKTGHPKIIIFTLTIIACLITFVIWWNNYTVEKIIISQAQGQMSNLVRSTGLGIEIFIHHIQEEISGGAENLRIKTIARQSILKKDESGKGFNPFKSIYNELHKEIDSLYLLDSKGVVLDRMPFDKSRIGEEFKDSPGVKHVLKTYKPYISSLFKTRGGEFCISVIHPIFKNHVFVGMLRAIIHINTIYQYFFHPIKIGDNGYFFWMNRYGIIYYHPKSEYIGKKIYSVMPSEQGKNEKKLKDITARILRGSEGEDYVDFKASSGMPILFSWTYVPLCRTVTGLARVEIKQKQPVPEENFKRTLKRISIDLDHAIPKQKDLDNTENLNSVFKSLQEKYPDITEITLYRKDLNTENTYIRAPVKDGSTSERVIVSGEDLGINSDNPGIQIVMNDDNTVDALIPIHTCENIWPLVCIQPYHEISGPVISQTIKTGIITGFLIMGCILAGFVYFRMQKKNAVLEERTRHLEKISQTSESLKKSRNQIHKLNAELENRVRIRTEQLESANRELEAFSYSVSHDLRAPLRHIRGFSQLLRKNNINKLNEKSDRYLNNIVESVEDMGRYIDDLLSFSRISRIEFKKTRIDLLSVIKKVKKQLIPDMEGRKIVWKINNLPEVKGGPSLMHHVMLNLIGNAIKFTGPVKEACVEIGVVPSKKNETVIYVRDNGVGFDMKYIDKVFGVFQRLHSSEEFKGTGIGLPIVQRIVKRHGGKTWAEGEVNKGATFYFSLPNE